MQTLEWLLTQLAFVCSNGAIETPEKIVKYVQNYQ